MKTRTKLFSAFLIAIFLVPVGAMADKILFFTPTRVVLDDKNKVEVMNISNLSDITRAYKISFQDLVMTRDGITTPVDTFEYSAKRMLRFVPREFTLKPGDRQTIRIQSRVGADVPDGEYHTHIRFLEDVMQRDKLNPKPEGSGAAISAPMAYEALIPAVISHGNVSSRIDAKDAKLRKDANTGKWVVDLVLTREGNAQGRAYIDTDYVSSGGEAISVTPRRTVYIYREVSERTKDIDFTLPEGAAPGGTVRLRVYDTPDDGAELVRELTLPLSQ